MKKVKISINGDLFCVDYCSKSCTDEEGNYDFFMNYYSIHGWDKIEALYVDDNEEENLVKKKGKYIQTDSYFADLFSDDGEHPLPVEIHTYTHYDVTACYMIELEDDEEFDIKKVQIVKSTYYKDKSPFPFFIVADSIMYDGKEIDSISELCDYEVESKAYNELEYDGGYY